MNPPPPAFDLGDLLGVLAGTICPALFCAMVSYLIGLFVFGPLYTRPTWKLPQTRFRIGEILILLAQLQLVGGGAIFLIRGLQLQPAEVCYAIAVIACLFVAFWWYSGIRMLSAVRVEQGLHRIVFLGIVLPAGYAAALALVLVPLAMVGALLALYEFIANGWWYDLAGILLMMLAYAIVVLTIVGVRSYCRKIADRARDDYAHEEGIDFGPVADISSRMGWQPMASEREVRIIESGPSDRGTDL